MASSEAQKKAINKYQSKALRPFKFTPNRYTHPKLIEYLESIENVQSYIRSLIYEDMKRQGREID